MSARTALLMTFENSHRMFSVVLDFDLKEDKTSGVYVLEKDSVGSKVLERNVFVSSSEIKAKKEQPDHEVNFMINENKYGDQWEQG